MKKYMHREGEDYDNDGVEKKIKRRKRKSRMHECTSVAGVRHGPPEEPRPKASVGRR